MHDDDRCALLSGNFTQHFAPWSHAYLSRDYKLIFCFSKAVVNREGNKLKVSLKGIESVTEMVDANTICNVSNTNCCIILLLKCYMTLNKLLKLFFFFQTMTVGGIVYKRISKRV